MTAALEPDAAPLHHLWIIGTGRLGLALGLALHRSGAVASLTLSGRASTPPEHPLFQGAPPRAGYQHGLHPPDPPPQAALLCVPDAAIEEVAASLAARPLPLDMVVLHASGARGAEALDALGDRGHPTGTLHPLVAVSHPVQGADQLRSGWFALDGDPAARALAARVVQALDGRALFVGAGAKPVYHAAAVFASNYVVALLAVAERLMREAGVEAESARAALCGLARGAVEGVERAGPAAALTGPVARGDLPTVAAHLSRLSPSDRPLYCLLAREALALARAGGLPAGAARELERLLAGVE